MRDPAAVGAAFLNELTAIRGSKLFGPPPVAGAALLAADLLTRCMIADTVDPDPIVKYGRPQDRPEGV